MKKKAFKYLSLAAGVLVLVLLILYTGGFLTSGKIQPGRVKTNFQDSVQSLREASAKTETWPDVYEAVGTVRPRTETQVEAQVRGRVLEVAVRPGNVVRQGDLLVLLDSKEYQARLEQSRQDLKASQAALNLAETEYGRLKRLQAVGAAPKRDLDRAKEANLRADAAMMRAEKQLEEARIALDYTRITASEPGQVTKRLIDPGDLALPGRPLLILQTGGALRLEALVREGLIGKVRLGQELSVVIPALARTVNGKIEEIAPSADPQTRTFLVKVLIPANDGIYSGMFGRLMIPVGESKVVVIPTAAVIRVGQLEMVRVKTESGWLKAHVTLGRTRDGMAEVLSGLEGGETLGIEAGSHD